MKKGITIFLLLASVYSFSQDSLDTMFLDQVVVTGQYEPQSISKSVFQVRTIPMEKISAKGAVRLQDVLNTELNIRFNQDLALGGSNITMQGLAGQNVKILIDGVPMVGRQGTTNEVNINQINVNTIERIEIIEGPMSVVYGADALAGVINIITKKSTESKMDLSLSIHEESVGDEYGLKKGIHNETIGAGFSKNKFKIRADLARNFFGGWQGDSTGREKQWHPKTQYLASAIVGYDWEKSNAYYRGDYLYEDIYNPGEFTGGEALDQRYITNRFMHQLQSAFTLTDKLQLNAILSFTDYQRKTQTTTVNEATGDIRLALGPGQQDLTKFGGTTFRTTAQYKVNSSLSFQPGVDINYETGTGGRMQEGNNTMGDYAFFVSGEWNITKTIQVRPGFRLVYNTVYDSPPVIPSINTKFRISEKQDIRLSYGRGFRAPSLRELYLDFFDASHQIEGNENLKSELSHSINGSWNLKIIGEENQKVTVSVGGFYNSIDNLIGYGQKIENPQITTYLNIEKYKTQGVTWNNTFTNGVWEVSAGIAYTGRFNQLNSSTNDLDRFMWSPELTTSLQYKIANAGLSFSMYYKYTGKTPFYELRSDNGTQTATLVEVGSYNWADVSVQKKLGQYLSLTGGVRNVFNITAVNNTATVSGVHTPNGARPIGYGRSYFISLLFSLSK